MNSKIKRNKLVLFVVAILAVAISFSFLQTNITFAAQKYATDTTVTVSLANGEYFGEQEIELSTDLDDAKIYYTLDGSVPTTASTEYTGAIKIGQTTKEYKLKAVAYANGHYSKIAKNTYMIYTLGENVALGKSYTTQIDYIRYMTSGDTDTTAVAKAFDGTFTITDEEGFQAYTTKTPGAKECGNIYNGQEYPTITVDLGATYTVNRFMWQAYTNPNAAASSKYMYGASVEVSTDGENFTKVFFTEKGSFVEPNVTIGSLVDGSAFFKMFTPTEARYVKFYGGVADPVDAKTVAYEFQIYQGTEEPYVAPVLESNINVALNKTIECDGDYARDFNGTMMDNISDISATVNDGVFSTDVTQGMQLYRRPAEGGSTGSILTEGDTMPTVTIDLGELQTVNRFVWQVYTGSANIADSYMYNTKVELSTDKATWVTVRESEPQTYVEQNTIVANGKAFEWYFTTQQARYVRISGGCSNPVDTKTNIMEFQIFTPDQNPAYLMPIDEITVDSLGYDATLDSMNEYISTTFGTQYKIADSNGAEYTLPISFKGPETVDANKGGVFTFVGTLDKTSLPSTVSDLYEVELVVSFVIPERGNITALSALIAQAEALNANDYTATSYAALNTSLTSAKAMIEALSSDLSAYTQTQIDEAANGLSADIAALVTLGNKTALNAYVENVKDVTSTGYTVDSFTAFTEALNAAKAINASNDVNQAQVDKALADLTAAFENLKNLADLTEINAYIATVENTNTALYTPATAELFTSKLNAAKAAVLKDDVSSNEIDAALAELKAAFTALTLKADKENLKASIAIAEEKIASSKYTASTIADLTETLNSAKLVNEDDNATVAAVNEATIAINEKIAALVELGNKTELSAKINEIEANKAKYTAASWSAFDVEFRKVKAINADAQASKTEVETALAKLNEDAKMLVLLGDKTELNALLAFVPATDKYTALSIMAYDAVKQNASIIANTDDASKDQVDAAVAELKAAKEGLVELADKTELNAKIAEAKKLLSGKYTAESIAALTTEVARAEALAKDSQATKADVAAEITALTNAMSGLKKTSGCAANYLGGGIMASLVLALGFVVLRKKNG